MKINEQNLAGVGGSQLSRTQGVDSLSSSKRTSSNSTDGAQDRAQLSALAERIRAADPQSSAHAQRLQKLAAVVQSGKYNLDAGAVSDALINESTSSSGGGSGTASVS